MDITPALATNSNQLNAIDIVAAPIDVTVAGVERSGNRVAVSLHESPGKPWFPSKGMLRILAKHWGKETNNWTGKRARLFYEPTVLWKGKPAGGIRISHISGIDSPHTDPLRINQEKSIPYTIQPLPDAPAPDPWQPRWAQISAALADAGVQGDGPALLAAAGELIDAEFTHPQQITDDQARAIHAALDPDAATTAQNKES